ncbi:MULTISPECIES: SMODS-associated NUDIX domain-containing protein [Bacteroidota]|uniref:SMODS-associated NUDIX domain-containing protein n=1 Tax=Bacteroidota TaxID=976 RepID=UPI0008A49421|nr:MULTISPECIES: HU-CCDC81 and SPOR domain-containing protein [Bacteroidota]OFV13729.1 hypothetical protein HMPREF3127_14665 [Sphingobacterium sp. HMSC13C05]
MIISYIILFILLALYLILGNNLIANKAISDLIHELAIGGLGTMIGIAITSILMLKGKIWVCLQAATVHRFKHIRISAAYIFKIEIDGKYLLVKGRNIDQFQPVGGVYKRLAESSTIFQQLEILDDKKIPICDTTRHDLRLRIKGKHLHKFLLWFDSQKEREISHWREFCEELILTNILDRVKFPHVNYKFLYRNPLYIHHSIFYECPEILIHEVFEFIPNESQRLELKKLLEEEKADSIYHWVSEDTIKRLGYTNDNRKPFSVAEHTISLFNKDFKVK